MKTNTASPAPRKKTTRTRRPSKGSQEREKKQPGEDDSGRRPGRVRVAPSAGKHELDSDSPAFIPNPEETHRRVRDDLAEYLGEGFIQSVTGADDAEPGGSDAASPDELGGPFIETDAATEFALGTNPMNGGDAYDDKTVPEAFPTAVRADGEPGRTTDEAMLLQSFTIAEYGEKGDDEANADDNEEVAVVGAPDSEGKPRS